MSIKKYQMELKVITSVHIGGADYKCEFKSNQYIYHNNKLHIVDGLKFMELLIKNNLYDDYIRYIEENTKKGYRQDKKVKLYDFIVDKNLIPSIPEISKRVFTLDKRIKNVNDVKLLLRNSQDRPYIPGSSIKGAIVNSLIINYIINHREEFKIERNKILNLCRFVNNDNKAKKSKQEIIKIVNEIENKILYQGEKSKIKRFGLSVSDTFLEKNVTTSILQDYDEELAESKINPRTVYREYMDKDSKFKFFINIDYSMFSKSMLKIKDIKDIRRAIGNATNYIVKEQLEQTITDDIKGGLILGANTGFYQKTVVHALFDNEVEKINVMKVLMYKSSRNKIGNHLNDKISLKVVNKIKINNQYKLAGVVKILEIGEKDVSETKY